MAQNAHDERVVWEEADIEAQIDELFEREVDGVLGVQHVVGLWLDVRVFVEFLNGHRTLVRSVLRASSRWSTIAERLVLLRHRQFLRRLGVELCRRARFVLRAALALDALLRR